MSEDINSEAHIASFLFIHMERKIDTGGHKLQLLTYSLLVIVFLDNQMGQIRLTYFLIHQDPISQYVSHLLNKCMLNVATAKMSNKI